MLFARAIRSTTLLQQRRYAKWMVLTFGGANKMYYIKSDALQIDVPTVSGVRGILAEHVPTIAVLQPGVVKVIETSLKEELYFVSSGSVSVLADSTVQVLAEEACALNDLDFSDCQKLVKKYISEKRRATTDLERVKADIALTCARVMYAAVQHTQAD